MKNPHKLRLLQLRERNDLRGEQMREEAGRFGALATRGAPESRAVSSFNLFQTPAEVARQMADALEADALHRVLEPSAGLGRLLDALPSGCAVTAIEEAPALCAYLLDHAAAPRLLCRDFLSVTAEELGGFDRIIMNPPFKMGRDVKHIMHAYQFLKPGGRLVALCYDGVKQNAKLKPWADSWQALGPAFKSEGTGASVCLLIKDNPL